MLEFKQVSRRSNTCELRVNHIAKSLITQCSTLELFEYNFLIDLKAIPRVNTSHCSDWYKIIRNGDTAIIWHLDIHSECDRKVAEIIELNKNDIYEGFFN